MYFTGARSRLLERHEGLVSSFQFSWNEVLCHWTWLLLVFGCLNATLGCAHNPEAITSEDV